MKKLYGAASEPLHVPLFDGLLIASGGSALRGLSETLLAALRAAGPTDSPCASHTVGATACDVATCTSPLS